MRDLQKIALSVATHTGGGALPLLRLPISELLELHDNLTELLKT